MYISNKSEKPRNPIPTVTIIIKDNSESNNTLLIRRARQPFKDHFSLPGGFVDYGERVEDAVKREAEEELTVKVEPIDILGVYSDPKRDPRGHIMSVTFVARITEGSNIKAKDDAVDYEWVDSSGIENIHLAFDHRQMLSDYRTYQSKGGTFWSF